jgi:two-component system LytT family response regulator
VEKKEMIKAILVDDDVLARALIAKTIADYCPNVTVTAEAKNVQEGVSAINEYDPDLVLLDIKMPDGSGFDLIKHFNKPDFKVIFVTGYMEYAINGYKFGAIDYILKPFDEEDLAHAVNKAYDAIRFEEKLKFKALAENFNSSGKKDRLVLKTSDQVHLVPMDQVVRIEADGNYSTFFLVDGRKVIVSKSIKDYEEMLIDKGFHRIHKSHIINIVRLSYFDKTNGGDVIMTDGSRVPVASRKREMLLDLFESMG